MKVEKKLRKTVTHELRIQREELIELLKEKGYDIPASATINFHNAFLDVFKHHISINWHEDEGCDD